VSAADFAHPEWLVWLSPIVALAVTGVGIAAFRSARRLAGWSGGRVRPGRRALAADAALCGALFAICVAAVGPRLAHREVRVSGTGADLVLLFDTSRSMDAADDPPSRLDRARRAALGVLESLPPGSRAALAAFGNRGVLLTPLSPDFGALAQLAAAVDTDLVRPAGSNLGDGLRASLEAFEAGSDRARVVVVLSDGEVRPALDAGDLGPIQRADVRVLCVAFGSASGATLPDGGVPLRDAHGEIVISRRVLPPLEALADATDGAVFLADAWGDVDLESVVASALRDARPESAGPEGESVRRVRAPLVLPFALAAFALLLGETLLAGGAARPARLASAGIAVALLGAWLFARGAEAEGDPTPRLDALESAARQRALRADEWIELGVARHEAGRSDEARQALHTGAIAALREDRADWAAVAYHDLGVDSLDRNDLESARDFFLEAVALAPAQSRSRFNLEWTLRALARPETPPPRVGEQPSEPTGDRPPGAVPDDLDLDLEEGGRDTELPRPRERAASEEARRSVADGAGEASPGPSPETGGNAPPREPLDPDELARWLARVPDDARPALRSAAEEASPRRSRRAGGVVW